MEANRGGACRRSLSEGGLPEISLDLHDVQVSSVPFLLDDDNLTNELSAADNLFFGREKSVHQVGRIVWHTWVTARHWSGFQSQNPVLITANLPWI